MSSDLLLLLLLLLQIKLPCTPDGLAAASALMARDESISITITGRAMVVLVMSWF
jgi:hypothetical protein